VLGLWAGEHGDGEGAKYWLRVLSEIKNRGVNDVCMIVCDGLKHLPAAVASVWPQTIVQACIVHLLRNSFKYASKKDWAAIAKALKPVYTATSETDALDRFVEFCEAWGRRYPAILRLWENAWAEFVPFLAFDKEIRTVICTTNAIWVFESSRRHAGLARDRGAGLEALQDPAAPVRDVQVLHRPRAGGEGPRHCRALPRVRLGESWAGELGGDGGVVAAAGVGFRRCAAGAVGLTGVVLVVAVDDPSAAQDARRSSARGHQQVLADPEHGIHRVGVPYGIDVADDALLQKITGNEREQHLTERLDVGVLRKLPGGVGTTDEIEHR